jgi:hypothetical protein
MKTYLLLLLLLLSSLGATPTFAHGGEDHGEAAKVSTAAGAQYFSVSSASDQFEVLLRYEPLKPGGPAHLRLFLSDFATNVPIKGAKLTFTVPEDDKVQLKTTAQGPGEYLLEGTFPKAQNYSLTVSIVAGERADLLLLEGIAVGKELPHTDEPAAATPWLTWKTALLLLSVFLAGVGVAALLFRRRRPAAPTISAPHYHEPPV